MRQVILNSSGALVVRSPRPTVEPGSILVRVCYSLISVGTEVAPLIAARQESEAGAGDAKTYVGLARSYIGKAVRDPRKAARRVAGLAESRLRALLPAKPAAAMVPQGRPVPQLIWEAVGGRDLTLLGDGGLALQTDASAFGYQACSNAFAVPEGFGIAVEFSGQVTGGAICVGLLAGRQGGWIGQRSFPQGQLDESLVLDAGVAQEAVVVIANAGAERPVDLRLDRVAVRLLPKETGAPHSEMDQQGWSVGYSVAGEVVSVGEGIADIAVGDLVACAGAGRANHADYVCVKRNLVCRIPKGCDPRWAATTTVGAIALQGVRRASPALGERIAVLGLGLIGLLTVQMLRASGCIVMGFDLDEERVARGLDLGMHAGASNAETFAQLVRDVTAGKGADRVLVTAATKSNAAINMAMATARQKGVVVIVGDVGLDIDRAQFYRKEIDLLMSTSYGPGRYDRSYEEDGLDYPLSYVRWTMNRNMAAYMELIANGQIRVEPLIDKIAAVADAPQVYGELAGRQRKPLGVLFAYDDAGEEAEPEKIVLRGHRKPKTDPVNYVLVGAGAFGTSMLVPQMEKQRDCFFLRGVVSRDAVRGGNFARTHALELVASDLTPILADPSIDMVVIATRHDQHTDQVVAALRAGKHVFVEKPLATTWSDLDRVIDTYHELAEKPVLMVGFNRRFSPAMQRLKTELANRRGPLVINYRLNGGFIPADHWIQGREGGGRNIGEACHMYDCFRFLTGAPVASIQAASIDPVGTAYLRNDNFCVVLTYADGSLCTLTYTAMGPKAGLGKERIEVFCDGHAYVIDDYKALYNAGNATPLWQAEEADKGHSAELRQLGECIISGRGAPIEFGQIAETTAVALRVEELLLAGGAEDGAVDAVGPGN